jgi:VWFA-related protein
VRYTVAAALCLAGAALYAQPIAPPVSIDLVIDAGLPLRPALTAADFSVTEAGEPVHVHSARLGRPADGAAPLPAIDSAEDERAAAASADRLIGIYIDEYHLDDDAAFAVARSALATFVRSSLGPRDLILVVKPLDPLVSLRMSADRESAARLIEGARPRQADYTPRSAFEQEFIAGAPGRIDTARNQIAFSGINALAQHLGRFEAGRKTLIVLSNRIARTAPLRGDGPLPGVESIIRVANRGRVAVYPVRPSPSHESGVQAVADRSTAAGDPLETLAAQTTGLVIDGRGVSDGLQRLLHDASNYYLLTIEPSARSSDGRLHEITVTSRRPGVVVRPRAAYRGVRSETAVASRRAAAFPEGLKVPRRASPLIRTWFGQSAGERGMTSVAFVWEPTPRLPGGRGPAIIPARVAMSVSTLDGRPIYSGAAGPSGRDSGLVPAERPQLTFSAEPGALLVQMEVLDTAGRVLDRDVRDLTVSAFRASLAFGSASVFRSRTERELRALLDGTSTSAPVAARQFSRAEHLVVRIPLITAGDEQPAITVRLQSRFGNPLRDLRVARSATAAGAVQVDLPLASLASGGYMLEFAARGSGAAATERVEFSVTP